MRREVRVRRAPATGLVAVSQADLPLKTAIWISVSHATGRMTAPRTVPFGAVFGHLSDLSSSQSLSEKLRHGHGGAAHRALPAAGPQRQRRHRARGAAEGAGGARRGHLDGAAAGRDPPGGGRQPGRQDPAPYGGCRGVVAWWPWWGGTGSSCAGSSRRARGRRRSAGRSRRHFEGCLGWPKTSSQDLSKGVRFQVEALVGLRELAARPEADRTAAESCSIGIRGSWIHFRSSLWLRSYRRRSYKISHDREKRPGSYT